MPINMIFGILLFLYIYVHRTTYFFSRENRTSFEHFFGHRRYRHLP